MTFRKPVILCRNATANPPTHHGEHDRHSCETRPRNCPMTGPMWQPPGETEGVVAALTVHE